MSSRRFLITGGSQGIGAALVTAARSAGHTVVFTGRDERAIETLAAATGAKGVRADVTSAEDNVRIMDRIKSKAVLVYYDIGNSTRGGFDVVREIEWLGKKRICQMHFKDNPGYLGEGKINIPDVVRAVSRINFEGFANLETDSPSKSVEPDMQRNLAYVRKTIAQIGG